MTKSKTSSKFKMTLFKMIFTAMLAALIILMTFTGIGYIPIGPLKLTVNVLPVAIGAVFLGPAYGAVLGLVFGLSSFFTCFGMDALGTILMGVNPFLLFIMCVVPRILCGLLPGLLFKAFPKSSSGQLIGSVACCALTPALNTVGFLSLMWWFFGVSFTTDPKVLDLLATWGVTDPVNSVFVLFALFAGTNALIEIATCLVLGTAICKALFIVEKKLN